jgi:nicotinamidase/pyrazinamidase
LHPDIAIKDGTYQFLKGMEPLKDGAEDTSYTGYNGYNDLHGLRVPEFLANRRVTTLVLGGLALDYCVKATALDFKQKMGLDVVVVTDATEPVNPETGLAAINELGAVGVRFATTAEVLQEMAAA